MSELRFDDELAGDLDKIRDTGSQWVLQPTSGYTDHIVKSCDMAKAGHASV